MPGLIHVTRYWMLPRMLAYRNAEVKVIADDEVEVLFLREIGRSVNTPLHVGMLYCLGGI